MSKYTFEPSLWIAGVVREDISLDVRDYLDCEDEDELTDIVNCDLEDKMDKVCLDKVDDSELSWNYPEGFLEEWRKLKNENN